MSTEVGIARRYARALFELINDGADHLQHPLQQLAEAANHHEVATLLATTSVPAEVKKGVLSTIVKDLPSEMDRLLTILADRNKLTLLPVIADQLKAMMQTCAEAVDVDLIAAIKLPAALRNKIAAVLEPVVGKKLNITTHQNKAIIGGFIVNIGDRRIDHSIRTRLNGMRTVLAG
ncbi:MAG: ATP synthase F1 subunit delta [Mariprofundales bacterium]